MKTKTAAALLSIAASLLATISPAMARFECLVTGTDGNPDGLHEYVYTRILDNYAGYTSINVDRQIFLARPAGYSKRSRFGILRYSGTKENPWKLNSVTVEYQVPVEKLGRPLFGFLILDSGEYIARPVIVEDSQGHRSKWPMKTVSLSPSSPRGGKENIFLSALHRAASMAFELKYSDGETLARETFDLKHTDFMQQTLAKVQKMERENCKYWNDPPEFH